VDLKQTIDTIVRECVSFEVSGVKLRPLEAISPALFDSIRRYRLEVVTVVELQQKIARHQALGRVVDVTRDIQLHDEWRSLMAEIERHERDLHAAGVPESLIAEVICSGLTRGRSAETEERCKAG